ncbi:TLP18.3/Psb32/MOLO-1 phosphatase superfamily protein [Gelidibacter sediminis]|uniref:TLP18.3/Psb32/MOLO-1 phosphatase superfamily protein n=1 Tax=Gelidibacter sediminis TaxID=1608710 RepID=A0A4R7PWW4_9FLAO|nr:TPM domain-containing protein [Gelidibacter sediminis]TDU39424.1 TLP18.3/Psb32/MOLO-1 phosphatase superfamily protein [Gelidibacter sediminis]
MSKIEDFLTAEEERQVVDAIRTAEKNTSGEIRVHLEKTSKIDVYERALEVFHMLKMDTTKLQNGVLIYVAVEDKTFVIFGDEGINNVVEDDFWESTKNIMQGHFKRGHFKQGLVDGILKAGKQLETHFPWEMDDQNEISDDISIG